jgi:hypothetical protein
LRLWGSELKRCSIVCKRTRSSAVSRLRLAKKHFLFKTVNSMASYSETQVADLSPALIPGSRFLIIPYKWISSYCKTPVNFVKPFNRTAINSRFTSSFTIIRHP